MAAGAKPRGRPPVGERVAVRLPRETLTRVDALAVLRGTSRAGAIRDLLAQALVASDGVDRAQLRRMLARRRASGSATWQGSPTAWPACASAHARRDVRPGSAPARAEPSSGGLRDRRGPRRGRGRFDAPDRGHRRCSFARSGQPRSACARATEIGARLRTEREPAGVAFPCDGAFLATQPTMLNLTTDLGDIDLSNCARRLPTRVRRPRRGCDRHRRR